MARHVRHKMSSRQLRAKMAHDPLFDSLNWVKNSWSAYGNKIVWAGVIVVVVYVGGQLWRSKGETRVEDSYQFLSLAKEAYKESLSQQDDEKQQSEREALDTVDRLLADYPGTTAAWLGLDLKGRILYQQADYSAARMAYQTLAAEKELGDLATIGAMGVARCAAGEEGAAAGVEEFKRVLAQFPDTPFADQVHFQIGRLYETLNRDQDALAGYRQIADDSEWYEEAVKRIKYLESPVVFFNVHGV